MIHVSNTCVVEYPLLRQMFGLRISQCSRPIQRGPSYETVLDWISCRRSCLFENCKLDLNSSSKVVTGKLGKLDVHIRSLACVLLCASLADRNDKLLS